MAGKPTDVIEDWTYGPVRWIGAGIVMGAAAVGIAWSISARRVPDEKPVAARAEVRAALVPTDRTPAHATVPAIAPALRPTVTELPPREAPAQGVALIETPEVKAPAPIPAPINVNTATVQQLETLPGIGPGLASKIVEDRSKNGRFRSLEDLDRVPGIGPKLLEKMRPLVAFE